MYCPGKYGDTMVLPCLVTIKELMSIANMQVHVPIRGNNLKFEIVYNNSIINRLLSLGPPCYAKLGLISVG
jgi:hypothetical protein